METSYDWLTVGLFCALIVLFLHRSVDVDEPRDKLWQYLVASGGCAGADWLGNRGHDLFALTALVMTLAFVQKTLAPFDTSDDGAR